MGLVGTDIRMNLGGARWCVEGDSDVLALASEKFYQEVQRSNAFLHEKQ